MYYIDSIPRKVYAFDYNEQEGTLANQRVCIDFAKDDSLGLPDGMCVDTQGRAWIAGFFGQAVTCWDTNTAEMVERVKIPAERTTSCCFGGPNFDWLFVTSASLHAEEEEKREFPNTGGIFVVKGLQARGAPAHLFKQ